MKYVVILQDSKVIATRFSDHKCWLHDGAVSIDCVDFQGNMQEIHHGELVDGDFNPQDKAKYEL